MTRAWDDAIVLLRGNRELVAIVAGVFFLLPSLVMAVLLADQQAQAMALFEAMLAGEAAPSDPAAFVNDDIGVWVGAGMVALVIQLIGYMALLALMDPREKPTVGQAIGRAFRSILPLIGAVLLFYIGIFAAMLLVLFVLALVVGLIVAVFAAVGGETAGTVVGVILFFPMYVGLIVGMAYVMARLSLILPAIVLGGIGNPVRAFTRSWTLTRGNGWRLLGFYALLMIAYMVISMVFLGILVSFGTMAASGAAGGVILGVFSALLGAAVSVVFTAIIAAVYHQLRLGAPEGTAEAFE